MTHTPGANTDSHMYMCGWTMHRKVGELIRLPYVHVALLECYIPSDMFIDCTNKHKGITIRCANKYTQCSGSVQVREGKVGFRVEKQENSFFF